MKKLLIIFWGIVAHSTSLFSQGTFSATYNFGNTKGIAETWDNKFIMFAQNGIGRISKVDPNTGNLDWTSEISFQGRHFFIKRIIETTDSNFVALFSQIGNPTFFGAIKVSSNGTLLWAKKYFATLSNIGLDLCATIDGGFIMVGSGCAGDNYAIRCDTGGSIIWQKHYKDLISNAGSSYRIKNAGNNNFYISGSNPGANNNKANVLFKINSAGDLLWFQKINMAGINFSFALTATIDGGATIAGNTNVLDSNIAYTYLSHFDSVGNHVWLKAYQDNYNGNSVNDLIQLNNGEYIASGNLFYNDIRNVQMLNFKTDVNGNLLWAKAGGKNQDGSGYDDNFCIKAINDSTILNGGTHSISKLNANGFGWCYTDSIHLITHLPVYTIETPTTIYSHNLNFISDTINYTYNLNPGRGPYSICTNITNIPDLDYEKAISISPNPFENEVNIRSDFNFETQISIYDITSKIIFQQYHLGSLKINTEHFSKGLYFYEIRGKNGEFKSGKIVKN